MRYKSILFFLLFVFYSIHSSGQDIHKIRNQVDTKTLRIEHEVIEWRHHIHQHPELSNREYETAKYIAAHLQSFGLEVRTGIAHTGVIGILKGGKPGPVVALRADMDALPVKERVNLPWASQVTGEYNGETVPVMHACGHDTHVAILLGVAEVLSEMKEQIPGTVKFLFQPAEEGAPEGEEGGGQLMVKEGALKNPDAEVIFGLHISSKYEVGTLHYRPEGMMAAVNSFKVKVQGKQTHGSQPWDGIDPVVTAALIIDGLQTVVSRRTDLTNSAAVVTVGAIHGGVRSNIIPEEVTMLGTIRSLDYDIREQILKEVRLTVIKIAESQGALATVEIDSGYPITYNDPQLTAKMVPTFREAAGADNVHLIKPWTGAEDFSFYQQEVPGLFFFLGGTPSGKLDEAFPHHTPDFFVTDDAMKLGIRTFCYMVFDYAAK